ncbi:hypothetical protein [Peptostreptococcus faecalis]|uniref:hypothetical protein n=1 Tax=Peptostreptococcus faecalis TaxID=2045015 RepID=UPI000C79D325|nr:hypothetical protein [Peptostreptococcus faecalis]
MIVFQNKKNDILQVSFKNKGKDKVISYVNALDGEILFNDITEDGRAYYDREKGRWRFERAVSIANVMKLKGIYSYEVGITSNGTKDRYTTVDEIKQSNINAFSFSGHSGNSIGTSLLLTNKNQDGSLPYDEIYPNNIPSNKEWKFAYLDACDTGKTDDWAENFKIWSTSKGKVLIETKDKLHINTAHEFSKSLEKNQKSYGGSLYDNFIRAKSDCNSRNFDSSLFNYRGDKNF